jgi:serine/threonine protein kinase
MSIPRIPPTPPFTQCLYLVNTLWLFLWSCWPLCGQGGLSLPQVVLLLKQCVAGLRHLHAVGIIHRDLRAANVLVDTLDPLQVYLADFGVSYRLSAFDKESAGDRPSASAVSSVVLGNAAMGPLQVGPSAPSLGQGKVCRGSAGGSFLETTHMKRRVLRTFCIPRNNLDKLF